MNPISARRLTAPAVALLLLVPASLGGCPGPRPVAERPPPRVSPVKGLAAQLADADWRKRADAAYKLGATRRADAVAPLAGAVADPDQRVRLAVVRACGAHGSPKLIPALKTGLGDKAQKVRIHAVRALARIGTREAAEAMIEALDGASMWLRPQVADSLAKLSPKVLSGLEVAIQILVAELDPGQKPRFDRLAKGLSAIGEPALQVLLHAMHKPGVGPDEKKHTPPDLECVLGPCQVLVHLGKRIIPQLMQMARDGVGGIDRGTLCQRLLPAIFGRIGRAAIPYVIAHLGKSGNEGTLAKGTLSKLGGAAVQPLLKLLRKRGQSVRRRAAAVRLLGKIRDKRATAALIEALVTPDRTVAHAAIRALAKSLTDKTFIALSVRLKKGLKAERLVIVKAARSVQGGLATRLLIGALKWGPVEVSLAAVRALGERKDKQAVPVLVYTVKKGPERLRLAAIRALGSFQDPTTFKTLARLARRGKKAPRLAAIRALGDLGTKPAQKLLKRLKKSRNKAIAKVAADALNPASLSKYGWKKLGIPECDAYLKVLACYIGKMPAAARGPTLVAIQKTIAAWQKMAAGPARRSLAGMCRMTMDMWKKAVRKLPRYRSCFGP